MNRQIKTRGQLISKLQHMKTQPNGNTIQHLGYKDIDTICNYLLDDKKEIKRLEKALDKACDKLQKAEIGTTCDEEYHKQCRENHCFKTCIHARPLTIEEWKEWCMKDE